MTGTDPASNIAAAAHEQGVGRIVCLSIAGTEDPRVNSGYGYYKGKAVQESIYQQAPVPSTTVRSTQWFDFVPATVGVVSRGLVALAPTMLMAPALREEVTDFVADVVTAPGQARHEIRAIRGPEVDTIANFARRILAAVGTWAASARPRSRRRPTWGAASPMEG
ncbi:SDR family oxidoreductase [Kocuria rhizophila]|uniref:SDR family oxidoreductase n=1 Tax=Kocuria rhizophila TaxID=72000 RepID=UPI00164340EA|nr:hypothetical protein [Kocuria rhizophila]